MVPALQAVAWHVAIPPRMQDPGGWGRSPLGANSWEPHVRLRTSLAVREHPQNTRLLRGAEAADVREPH